MEKPLIEDEILSVVQRAFRLRCRPEDNPISKASRPSERWTSLMVCLLASAEDPRTLEDWAKLANISVATLKNRCRVVGTTAKGALTLGRFLRAVHLATRFDCEPHVLLDADPRTFKNVLDQLGLPHRGSGSTVPFDAAQVLTMQSLIPSRLLVESLRRAVAESLR